MARAAAAKINSTLRLTGTNQNNHSRETLGPISTNLLGADTVNVPADAKTKARTHTQHARRALNSILKANRH